MTIWGWGKGWGKAGVLPSMGDPQLARHLHSVHVHGVHKGGMCSLLRDAHLCFPAQVQFNKCAKGRAPGTTAATCMSEAQTVARAAAQGAVGDCNCMCHAPPSPTSVSDVQVGPFLLHWEASCSSQFCLMSHTVHPQYAAAISSDTATPPMRGVGKIWK